MNKDNVLTIAAIILGLGGWCFYNLDFKKKEAAEQQHTQNEYKYDINEYRKQQEEKKRAAEECLQIVGDYLKRYGYNVTHMYTTSVQLTDWKYNVRGTITNPNGTTRAFGVLYDYSTKTILTCDID